MAKGYQFIVAIAVLTCGVTNVNSQMNRICATSKFDSECADLKRGNSEVSCVYVQDSIECAQRIANGTADLGLFSAESTLLLSTKEWPELMVTKELRHVSRAGEPVDFESVVIVRADHKGGIEGLQGKNFCHPGLFYDRTQRWSELFLKHFERTILNPDCKLDGQNSAAEMEASVLARFFKSSCRPGRWSHVESEDIALKKKFPALCSLCGTEGLCSYVYGSEGSNDHEHRNALFCLKERGDVTYVSKQSAINFFTTIAPEQVENFAYMCPNGTLYNILGNERPCTWLRQPWGVVISRSEKAIDHASSVQRWARGGVDIWEEAIKNILSYDNNQVVKVNILQSPKDYVKSVREVPIAFETCISDLAWCTTSYEEKEKCEVIRSAGISTGIQPAILCKEPVRDTLTCLNNINTYVADFMGIDSNFGYLARNVYNLTAALYTETENDKFASVAILVRAVSSFESLNDLKGKRVCMPEFGGIASMAFINNLKSNKQVPQNQCDFGRLLAEYFDDSCIPGATDKLHDPEGTVPKSLCNLCRTSTLPVADEAPNADVLFDENGEPLEDQPAAESRMLTEEDQEFRSISTMRGSCDAGPANRYYGNRGALQCLNELGDVAIVESQFLLQHARDLRLDPNEFKILCRNGSLADRTGFQVEENCLLTTIIDGEIVVRRNKGNTTAVQHVIQSLDRYFLSDPKFQMYNIFAGQKNLLFKDSTIGLVSADSSVVGDKIQNYIDLFVNVEKCNDPGAATSITINIFMTLSLVIVAILFSSQ